MTPEKMMVMFLWGFVGSVAVEVVFAYQHLVANSCLPERYHTLSFWILRLLLALVGGGLALAYEINKPLLALNIGASTPLIIRSLADGVASTVPKVKR